MLEFIHRVTKNDGNSNGCMVDPNGTHVYVTDMYVISRLTHSILKSNRTHCSSRLKLFSNSTKEQQCVICRSCPVHWACAENSSTPDVANRLLVTDFAPVARCRPIPKEREASYL